METSDYSPANVDDCDNQQFNHDELVKLTRDAIEKIIESDPLFKGLPCEATIEEIKAQTAVAQGQAITLYLNRGKLPKLSIVVMTFITISIYPLFKEFY